MERVELCYPNFGKKAITFSIDDGNLRYDRIFIDTVGPHGIRGTFNLCHADYEGVSNAELCDMYRGFEIANHCKLHPFAFADGECYEFSAEPFDPSSADGRFVYRDPKHEGMYLIHRPRGWRRITDSRKYTELIDEAKSELESVFGAGSIVGFAWPFGEQKSRTVSEHLAARGYNNVRKTGYTLDTTAFDIPKNTMAWCCNANHATLLETARLFAEYPDDGRLKMLSFGVHSADFESSGKWDDLRRFAEEYGDRPNEFWYATVGEIFNYAEAAEKLSVLDGCVTNGSEQTLYMLVDGERHTLLPGASLALS